MKIILMCAAGMSTSLLVTKMEDYTKKINRDDIQISARSVEDLDEFVDDYDIFLLGPQVRYKEIWVKSIVEPKGKKFANIPPQVYGRFDGKKTLELAFSL
ncbi:PTS sugar transporter subunit IIB [Clostridium estertheticum]|uniref:PTS sugar transporter subunit IIB n=1 Tax=Clostridium estertheticum TaxID=238834 RepID=UPI0013EE5913|nr:PTS sugar transporter subunit IIB [Clostridium estertheticum]MBZ9607410.1 PTS sugar transporter subunit IIB [Clostridium estertheticum]